MENENDKIASENKNEQPKPTDDVQMDIETVVPSAHQAEVTPGKSESPDELKEDQATDEQNNKDGEKVTEGEEGEEKSSATADEHGTEKESSPEEVAPKEEERTNDQENTGDTDTAGSNQEHNGIETVTP